MRNLPLALGLFGFTLACFTTGCSPQVSVEGGPDQAQTPTGSNPYTPTTPDPSGHAPNNIIAPGHPGPCKGPELHVVGIYDPYDTSTKVQGPAHVHIDRPGSIILFLSSYSATNWTVTAGPATHIDSIVAHAYEPVTVSGPPGVPVETIDFEENGLFMGCGYEYPDADPFSGCETPDLLAAIEKHMGQPALSFHGCYAASDFLIRANLVSSSNCAIDMGYRHTSMVATSCATPPPVPPNATDVCADKSGVSHYEGYFCNSPLYADGNPFLLTQNISCNDARANCALNAEANAGTSIQCLWNGEAIYAAGAQSNTCTP